MPTPTQQTINSLLHNLFRDIFLEFYSLKKHFQNIKIVKDLDIYSYKWLMQFVIFLHVTVTNIIWIKFIFS